MGVQSCQVPRHRALRVNNERAAGAARGEGGGRHACDKAADFGRFLDIVDIL